MSLRDLNVKRNPRNASILRFEVRFNNESPKELINAIEKEKLIRYVIQITAGKNLSE